MTTETNVQDQAKAIWEQLDSEDAGASRDTSGSSAEFDAPDNAGTAQAAPREGAEQTSDALDDDPQAMRNKLAGLESIINQLSGRLRNAEGHIGGLNSQVKQQLDAAKQVKSTGADAPSAAEIRAAQGSPQALADLEREYPEFAQAVGAAINEKVTNLRAELEQRLPAQATDSLTRRELDSFKAEMAVETRHPGWQTTVKAPEFIGWMQNSPREFQMLAASDDPQDAIRLLDMYAETKKSGATQRTQRLTSAAALPTGLRSSVRAKNVDDMSPTEFWAFLDSQDKKA